MGGALAPGAREARAPRSSDDAGPRGCRRRGGWRSPRTASEVRSRRAIARVGRRIGARARDAPRHERDSDAVEARSDRDRDRARRAATARGTGRAPRGGGAPPAREPGPADVALSAPQAEAAVRITALVSARVHETVLLEGT